MLSIFKQKLPDYTSTVIGCTITQYRCVYNRAHIVFNFMLLIIGYKSNTNKIHVLQGLNHNLVRYIFTTKELAGDISTVNALNFQTKVTWQNCLDRVLNVCY